MKTQLVAAAFTAAVSGAAFAQSVQLYGVLDSGVEHLTHAGPSGGSLTRMPTLTGGQMPSRLGFRGVEDLGGGLRATFDLESGIAVDSGSFLQGGRAFGRQATVGLGGFWGSVTLGRQAPAAYFALVGADVIGPAVFSLYAFDIYPAISWVDNSIAYRGSFAGFTLGATYSRGRDGAAPANCAGETSGNACTARSALVRYDAPSREWGAALGYDEQRGGGTGGFTVVSGRPALPASSSHDRDKRFILDGYFTLAKAKIGGGWIKRNVRTAAPEVSTDLYFLGLTYPISAALSIDTQVSRIRNKDMNADADMLVLRANYALSKRTSVYVIGGHMRNKGASSYSVSVSSVVPVSPGAGVAQSGLMVGMRHSF